MNKGKLIFFINGVILGVIGVLITTPLLSFLSLKRNVELIYQPNFQDNTPNALLGLLSKDETTEAVLALFYYQKDGIPAADMTKLMALSLIEEAELFNVSLTLGMASAYQDDPEVRDRALSALQNSLKKSSAGLYQIIDTLEKEDDLDLRDRKIAFLSKYLFIEEESIIGKEIREIVTIFKERFHEIRG